MIRDDPGAARLALVGGVVHLDEPAAVFDAMLTGWERQQRSRGLVESTVDPRVTFIRRFQASRSRTRGSGRRRMLRTSRCR